MALELATTRVYAL